MLKIEREIFDRLMQQARDAGAEECCGLILSGGDAGAQGALVSGIVPARNVHPAPATHFEIDPAVLIAAYRAEREGGARVMGFYHSHPTGPARPSLTDAAMAAHDGKIWAIIGQSEGGGEAGHEAPHEERREIRFWRDGADGFMELSYSVENG